MSVSSKSLRADQSVAVVPPSLAARRECLVVGAGCIQPARPSGPRRHLRGALLSGEGLSGSLRACWYRHPLFASTLMSESLRLYFLPVCDLRLITAFIARVQSAIRGVPGTFPSREAEAVISACLGELRLLDKVHPSRFSYPEIGIAILGQLFDEWRLDSGESRQLFVHVEQATNVRLEAFPELESGEEWFALRMHQSPFVYQLIEPSSRYSGEG